MGNNISNPNNNDQFANSLLGQEIKNIVMDKTVPNVNNVKFFEDENRNKNIKINQLKACCVGAVGEPGGINSTLGIPFPIIDPSIKDIKTDCTMGKNCLMTKNVGLTIETKDRTQYCGSNMDSKSKDAKSCDALLTDSCAKQLYEQGCIKLSGKKNFVGKSLASWNSKNPTCTSTIGGRQILYTGGPECTCVNSFFGPTLNKGPSYDLYVNKNKSNPYGLTDKTLDFDDNNEDTVYSLNIFKQDAMAMHPGVLDDKCISKKNFRKDTAYNMSFDRDVQIGAICITAINLSDSNVGKAVFEGNTFENNCANQSGKDKKPPITDDEDVRLAEEQKKREEEKRKADEDKRLKDEEEKRKADEAKSLKEVEEKKKADEEKRLKEDYDNSERVRLAKLAAEQEAKYQDTIRQQEINKQEKDAENAKIQNQQTPNEKPVTVQRPLETEQRPYVKNINQELTEQKPKSALVEFVQKTFNVTVEESSLNLYIAGAVGVVVIILILIMMRPKSRRDKDDDESE